MVSLFQLQDQAQGTGNLTLFRSSSLVSTPCLLETSYCSGDDASRNVLDDAVLIRLQITLFSVWPWAAATQSTFRQRRSLFVFVAS